MPQIIRFAHETLRLVHRLKTNNNLPRLFALLILLEGLIIRHIYAIKMYNLIICELSEAFHEHKINNIL